MEIKAVAEKERTPISAIIFDLDGLLIDSEPIWDRAYYVFLEQKGLKETDFSQSTNGMGLREFIEIWKKEGGLIGDTQELLEEFRSVFYKVLFEDENLRLLDGARDLLLNLRGKYKLAVSTGGHKKEMIDKILNKLLILQFFGVVVSSDDVEHGKPYPDVNLEIAKKFGVDASNCLVFEDSVNGVLAAKAAGMRVIGVNRDEKIRQELAKAGADEVYASLKDVQL